MRDRDRLRRLSARLARGRPIRWDDEEKAAATEDERAAIRELRVVAAMTAFNESVQSEDLSQDMGVSVSIARSVVSGGPEATASAQSLPPPLPAGTRWGHLEILESIG